LLPLGEAQKPAGGCAGAGSYPAAAAHDLTGRATADAGPLGGLAVGQASGSVLPEQVHPCRIGLVLALMRHHRNPRVSECCDDRMTSGAGSASSRALRVAFGDSASLHS